MPPDVRENIPEMKLYCYSIEGFKHVMEKLGYGPDDEKLLENDNIAVISICCTDTLDVDEPEWREEHYFNNKSGSRNVMNIEFDDIDPETWNPDFDIEDASDDDFIYDPKDGYGIARALDYEQSKNLVLFIVRNLGKDFYIHCSAGVSRSGAIARFILDCFSYPGNKRYNYKTREGWEEFPNPHVLRMLKRTYFRAIQ